MKKIITNIQSNVKYACKIQLEEVLRVALTEPALLLKSKSSVPAVRNMKETTAEQYAQWMDKAY